MLNSIFNINLLNLQKKVKKLKICRKITSKWNFCTFPLKWGNFILTNMKILGPFTGANFILEIYKAVKVAFSVFSKWHFWHFGVFCHFWDFFSQNCLVVDHARLPRILEISEKSLFEFSTSTFRVFLESIFRIYKIVNFCKFSKFM